MLNKIKSVLGCALLAISMTGFSQIHTKSPYTIYGMGELVIPNSGAITGIGGAGVVSKVKNQINLLNPAALTSQDTMSFILDFGLNGTISSYSDSKSSMDYNNMGFDHIAFAFPVFKRMNMAAGISPYSKVGYSIYNERALSETITQREDFRGKGGLYKTFIGGGIDIYKGLSVGAKANFIFGTTEHTYEMGLGAGSILNKKDSTNSYIGIIPEVGFLYQIPLANEEYKVSIGGTYTFESTLYTDSKSSNITTNGVTQDTIFGKKVKFNTKLPDAFAIGIGFEKTNHYSVQFNYRKQDWSNFARGKDNLKADESYLAAFTYTPEYNSPRYYYKRIEYRLGLKYRKTYYNFDGNQITNTGISFGVSLPTRSNSRFNIGAEFGEMGTTSDNLIKQKYAQINLSLSLFDIWFFKRKYD